MILRDHRRIYSPPLTKMSLCDAWLYSNAHKLTSPTRGQNHAEEVHIIFYKHYPQVDHTKINQHSMEFVWDHWFQLL